MHSACVPLHRRRPKVQDRGLVDPPDSLAGSARRSSPPKGVCRRQTHQACVPSIRAAASCFSSLTHPKRRAPTKTEFGQGSCTCTTIVGRRPDARSKRAMCACVRCPMPPHLPAARTTRRAVCLLVPKLRSEFQMNGPRATSAKPNRNPQQKEKKKPGSRMYVARAAAGPGASAKRLGWGSSAEPGGPPLFSLVGCWSETRRRRHDCWLARGNGRKATTDSPIVCSLLAAALCTSPTQFQTNPSNPY